MEPVHGVFCPAPAALLRRWWPRLPRETASIWVVDGPMSSE